MQVKVFYEDKTRIVDTTRTSTYDELLDEVMKVLEIKDKKENCRLRSYNVPNKMMQEAYTGNELMRLNELKIYPQKSLALEIKKEGEKFEEYDPNKVQIKINFWCPDITVIDEIALKPEKIVARKDEKLAELIEYIVKTKEIHKDFLM